MVYDKYLMPLYSSKILGNKCDIELAMDSSYMALEEIDS
jgi:hypothetical protein